MESVTTLATPASMAVDAFMLFIREHWLISIGVYLLIGYVVSVIFSAFFMPIAADDPSSDTDNFISILVTLLFPAVLGWRLLNKNPQKIKNNYKIKRIVGVSSRTKGI